MQLSKRALARPSIQQSPQADGVSLQETPAAHSPTTAVDQHASSDHHRIAAPLVAPTDRIRRLLATTFRERETI
jgi:hypothetical protein